MHGSNGEVPRIIPGIDSTKNAKANQHNVNGKPWTYADIAEETGLDEKTVGRFIRREQAVDENSARAICQALSVDAMEVIDFKKDRNGQLDKNDLAFSITGSFEKSKINVAKLKAIEASLREFAGDVSLQIVDIEEGSIKIILEGSQEGLERLEELFKSGELNEVLSIPVENVEFTTYSPSTYNEDLTATNNRILVFTISGNVDKNDIQKLKTELIKANTYEPATVSNQSFSSVGKESGTIILASDRRIRALIVDDHELSRRTLELVLSLQREMEVVGSASNSEEAIKLIARCHPDIIFIDPYLPYENYDSLADYIKIEHPMITLIMIDEIVDKGINFGSLG